MADTWKPGRRLAPLCLAALVTVTSQVGAVAAGAIEWRPETLSAIGRTAAALPTVEQRITVTPSGGLRIQLLELSPAQSRAGLRPLLAPVVDGCGVRWLVRLEVASLVTAMLNDAGRAAVRMCFRSAYRSFDEQVAIRLDLGCANYPEPTRTACVYDWTGNQVAAAGMGRSARPGFSRHQQGLAFDVQGLTPGTALGNWVTANSHRYGFYRFGDFAMLGPTGAWGLDDPGHVSIDGG